MPTRQTSSSGRPKSPRIQVVLPEELCARLATLAEAESRTVSNMAKVLIQQGVDRLERQLPGSTPGEISPPAAAPLPDPSAPIRAALEQRQQQVPRPLRRGPRRVRLQRPPT
ncbi:MAG: ribbon-helix-helix domain-containing protein [Cyanobium sp.]